MIKSFFLTLIEKKTRTLLVLLSIAASVALIFITIGISNTATASFYSMAKQWAGTSDVTISVKDEVGASGYMDASAFSSLEGAEYCACAINCYGYLSDDDSPQAVTVFGMDYEDLLKYNPIEFSSAQPADIGENEVVISSKMAAECGYSLGDRLSLRINRQELELTIAGISESSGLFIIESDRFVTVVNRQMLEKVFDRQGMCNTAYLKMGNSDSVQDNVARLQSLYPQYNVSESFSEAEVESNASITTRPFYLASLFIIVMGIFIIYSSFQIIMAGRLQIIGTFRSVGATKKKVKGALLLESLVFGLTGSVLGCVLGLIFMGKVLDAFSDSVASYAGTVTDVKQFLLSLLFGIILTVVSTYLPIARTGKLQIKEIILGISQDGKVKKQKKGFAGIVICILIIIACQVVPRVMGVSGLSLYIDIACMVLTLFAGVILVTSLTRALSGGVLGNGGRICSSMGIRNVNESKNLLNVMKLMVIAVSCVILIRGMTASISYSLTTVYSDYYDYDFMMEHRAADAEVVEQIKNCEGVTDAIGWNYASSVYLPEYGGYISMVYGIEDGQFFDYMKAKGTEENTQAIEKLSDGRNIILTEVLSGLLGLKSGDRITLQFDGKDYEYTVSGVVDCAINLGNMAYISAENMKKDDNMTFYSALFVRCSDSLAARNAICSEFQEDVYYLESFDDIQKDNYDNVLTIFGLLSSYALVTLIIGIVGIINNIIISFIERKREFAIYRSLGMDISQIRRMLISESLCVSAIGMLTAIACGLLMLSVAPYMLKTIFGDIVLVFQPMEYLYYLLGGCLVMILMGIFSSGKIKNNSVVAQLKCE